VRSLPNTIGTPDKKRKQDLVSATEQSSGGSQRLIPRGCKGKGPQSKISKKRREAVRIEKKAAREEEAEKREAEKEDMGASATTGRTVAADMLPAEERINTLAHREPSFGMLTPAPPATTPNGPMTPPSEAVTPADTPTLQASVKESTAHATSARALRNSIWANKPNSAPQIAKGKGGVVCHNHLSTQTPWLIFPP
jgi:hypothetical protein